MIFNFPFLVGALIFLIILSAFFSGSETGMMSINRYRLRHMARRGEPKAKRILALLERPDRLLGVVLLGNTFANVFASAVATILAVHYFGEVGILVTTCVLTMIILVFAEAAPKTLAALHPMRVAFFSSFTLQLLLRVFYPFVFVINAVANGCLALFGIKVKAHDIEPLSAEELRTVVNETAGKISLNYRQMLLRILDLERVNIEDIMVPRSEIVGINLEDSWDTILKKIMTCDHEHVPLYRESIDRVEGMLNLRKTLASMQQKAFDKAVMVRLAEKPYFVPEGALVSKQLLNFQREQKNIGLVVGEYGDIQGLISLQDILEEIVGEFSLDINGISQMLEKHEDGSYLVSGNMTLRELNRITGWNFPTHGPRTLSGLMIERLETIPSPGVITNIKQYFMEVVQVSGNRVRQIRIWPESKTKREKEKS